MAPTIATLSVEAFGRKLRSGAIASRAVTEECLRRIDSASLRLQPAAIA
jgi:hypothetical protein